MKTILHISLLGTLFFLSASKSNLNAKGFGSSSGLNLEKTSARPAALGEAFTTATNDAFAIDYNPASMGTLRRNQLGFSYEKGVFEDSSAQMIIAAPFSRGGAGFKLDYYNGGSLQDEKGNSVIAQQDLVLALSLARRIKGIALGVTGKFLSSTLAERASAQAGAFDLGMNLPVSPDIRWGLAFQNIGTKLKYQDEANNLPRIARTGFSFALFPKSTFVTTFFVDAHYYMNEQYLQPGLGLETTIGMLGLRGGYKKQQDEHVFTVGTGIEWGSAAIDYAFGLTGKEFLNKMSFALHFGSPATFSSE